MYKETHSGDAGKLRRMIKGKAEEAMKCEVLVMRRAWRIKYPQPQKSSQIMFMLMSQFSVL